MCGARVWFFRNKRGGCAYFDAIGIPWPKHPCMAGFRFDDSAAQQARTAYERARKKAEARARKVALAGERRDARRAQRANRKAERDARVTSSGGEVSKAPAAELHRVSTPTPRAIGWWTVMAMLLAWFASLPLSIASFNEPDDSPAWVEHVLVTMPTVVSFPAMVWFLWKIPVPKPSIGRLAWTIVQVPIFLTVGILSFLFTLGIGSFVFAWTLYRQTQIASTVKGTATA